MLDPPWEHVLGDSPNPERARHYLAALQAENPQVFENWSAEEARPLMSLFAGSKALSELVLQNPEWVSTSLTPEALAHRRRKQGLETELDSWLEPLNAAGRHAEAYEALRRFKQREMVRIGARDLARLGSMSEVMAEISDLADVCLSRAFTLCWQQMVDRFGQPHHQDPEGHWLPTPCTVLALGKLGGQELNYSSDVDLMVIYGDEGEVFKGGRDPSRRSSGMSNHRFFSRLVEHYVNEVSRRTPSGWLYRIDMRLRPEGNAGPLARSLGSCENYYAQWGEMWERMMLIKARPVAGDAALAEELLETIQPFRFPRSISEALPQEVYRIKERIEREVVRSGEIDRNVKLGRGGIREIEFITQVLQLLHGGRMPFLQGHQTLSVLEKLQQYGLLPEDDVQCLSEAYGFLRSLEHRLQMEENLQTHTVPTDTAARERLAHLMGFDGKAAFEEALTHHTREVRRVYDQLLGPYKEETVHLPRDFEENRESWKKILSEHGFRDVDQAFHRIQELVYGPGYVHVSARTSDLAFQLLQRFLDRCPGPAPKPDDPSFPMVSDPDRVLARIDSFVASYRARTVLFETWAGNPSLFDLLIRLFDASEFLGEMAIREPDLVDDLELSGHLRRHKTAKEILQDLRYGSEDADQRYWMRRYHRTEFMRLGLRDILGLADYEQNLRELSALADACLQYALEVVQRRYGLEDPPFAIVGFGKLGGEELNYGSDLDILFVAGSGTPDVSRLRPMAMDVMDLLSTRTEEGLVFATDARLRPDGEAGLLVNTLEAHEHYYRHRAQLWELQALSRARPIAGDSEVGEAFERLVADVTNFKNPTHPPAALIPQWREQIHRMRLRIEKERTPAGKEPLAIKTGRGGLIDAEFVAQAIALAEGWHEPNTLKALERAQSEAILPPEEAELLIPSYCKLRRVEGTLRRWSFRGEAVLPADPAPLYRVAVRCGFDGPQTFLDHVADWRAKIRQVYHSVFPFASGGR